MSQNGKHRGKVCWFSDAKGYGFVKDRSDGREYFVHFSAIVSEDKRKKLESDQVVEFEIGQGEKGPVATSVRVIG